MINTIKKYTLPVLIAGSIAYSMNSCDRGEIPIYENVKKELVKEKHQEVINTIDSLINNAEEKIILGKKQFNQGILEKEIDSTMLFEIHHNYKESVLNYEEANKLAEKYDFEEAGIKKEDWQAYKAIHKSAYGVGWFGTEIDKQLEKQGIEGVKVFNPWTAKDDVSIFFGKIGSIIGMCGVLVGLLYLTTKD